MRWRRKRAAESLIKKIEGMVTGSKSIQAVNCGTVGQITSVSIAKLPRVLGSTWDRQKVALLRLRTPVPLAPAQALLAPVLVPARVPAPGPVLGPRRRQPPRRTDRAA